MLQTTSCMPPVTASNQFKYCQSKLQIAKRQQCIELESISDCLKLSYREEYSSENKGKMSASLSFYSQLKVEEKSFNNMDCLRP